MRRTRFGGLARSIRPSRRRRTHNPETDIVHPLCWLISRPIGAPCREFAARHPRATTNYFASAICRTVGIVWRGVFIRFWVEPIAAPFVDIAAHVQATVRTDAGWIAANGCRPLEAGFRRNFPWRHPIHFPKDKCVHRHHGLLSPTLPQSASGTTCR